MQIYAQELLIGLLFFTLGVLSAAVTALRQRAWSKHGLTVTGVVVKIIGDEERGYAPVIDFTTLAGELRQFTSRYFTDTCPFEIDQHVALVYHPHNPRKVVIPLIGGFPYKEMIVVALLVAGFGLFLVAAAFGIVPNTPCDSSCDSGTIGLGRSLLASVFRRVL